MLRTLNSNCNKGRAGNWDSSSPCGCCTEDTDRVRNEIYMEAHIKELGVQGGMQQLAKSWQVDRLMAIAVNELVGGD